MTRVLKDIFIFTAIWLAFVGLGCKSRDPAGVIDPIIADDLQITLDRRGCMGTCPVYVIIVRADGSVLFNGAGFTKIEGSVQDKITREDVLNLVTEFKNADFFALNKNYGECQDTPLEVITFVQNGKTKTVSHGLPCGDTRESAEELKIADLGHQIDAVTRSERWVKGEPQLP